MIRLVQFRNTHLLGVFVADKQETSRVQHVPTAEVTPRRKCTPRIRI